MKIGVKLAIGFAVVVSLIIPTALFSLRTYDTMHKEFEALKSDIIPGALAMAEMETAVAGVRHHLMEYLAHERQEEETLTRSVLDQLRQTGLEHLQHERHVGPEEKAKAEQLLAKIDAFASAVVDTIDLGKQGASSSELVAKDKAAVHAAADALSKRLQYHKTVHMEELAQAEAAVHRAHVAGGFIVLAATICAALAAVAAAFITTRSVTKPLRTLQEAARQIADGDLDYRIDMKRKDEIGQLGRAFDQMSTDLSKTLVSKTTLEQANEQLAAEIDQRKQAEGALKVANRDLTFTASRLEQVNRELKDFVYVASHDLREPLRKISAFGSLLKNSLQRVLEGDDRENLGYMIDGADRMTQMIEGLLLYSRLNTRDEPSETVDLNEIVQRLERFELAAVFVETGATVDVRHPLPKVKGDPAQLGQLLQNLIANGIKYRRDEVAPQITVRATALDDQTVRIEVADNGIGIAQEHYQDIFKMFKRLHSRRKYQGTGIGLAVCKRIVDRHRGRIGVESTEGEGSTFWFTLAIAEHAPVATEPAAVSQ